MTEIDIKTYKKSKLPTNPKPNSVYYILPTPSSKVIVYITDQNGVPKIIESEGAIDLSYIASPTNGIVTSDTGTDATIPLANNTNAGLLTPAEKTKISTALQSSDLSNLVPYTGTTADVDLGEFQLKAGQIELDQTPTGTAGVGIIRWNDEDGTIDVGLKGGNVTLQVGQEQVLRVVNKTGVNLLESEYKCVYISGAQGNRLKVDLALSNNTLNSNKTIGLVTENINNNLEGFVTTVGLVRGINTTGSLQGETWADGDVLYLSAVSAGSLTNIAPTTPNHKVVVGYIVRAHITQGSIFVKVDTGLAITELHDVNITATTANKVIGSTTEGIWANKTIPEILGYTPANINSPTFTGVPTAPTATAGTNTTQLATTAFVLANAGGISLSANNIWTGIQTYLNGKLGLRNVADTFTSFFTNSNTASRTYTLPNRDMTVGDVTTDTDQDISGIKNFTSDIKLSNYPNTRNDGALPSNKILSTDVNGNLKLYTMAVMPAPFLEILIPDSTLPSTTTNFVLKGSFFTPTMTVVIVGQTINYITFISDNEVRVNVTTGASEGSFSVTLNNGTQSVFPNALLIVLGTVFIPLNTDWTSVSNLEAKTGELDIITLNSSGSAIWNKPFDYTKNFSLRFQFKQSPYGAATSNNYGQRNFEIINTSDSNFNYYFNLYCNGSGFYADTADPSDGSDPINNGLLGTVAANYLLNQTDMFEFKWTSGVMKFYVNSILKRTFSNVITQNQRLKVTLSEFDEFNIKYIELAS